MTLMQLQVFLEVSLTKNLSVAANRLFISQSSLSKYIAQMEKELGFPLFVRGNRGVALTLGGEQFLRHVREPYYDLIGSIQVGAALGRYRTIRLALPHEQQIPDRLLSMIQTWNQEQTTACVSMEYDTPEQMVSKLLSGTYDMLISDEPGAEVEKRVRCTPLFPLRSVLAFHDRHPNADRENLTLADFSEDTFLVSLGENSEQLRQSVRYVETLYGFRPKFHYTSSASSSLLNVISGLGVAIIPELYIRSDMTRIRTIPIEDIEPHWCNLVLRAGEQDAQILSLKDSICNCIAQS